MKRTLSGVGLALLCGACLAQSNFTIKRPADGSVVREVVKVRFPKASISNSMYVTIRINGKFVESAAFDKNDVEGTDYIYKLDTKGRKIPDGKMTIEARLYGPAGDRDVMYKRSSVEVLLQNNSGVKIPEDGLLIRYKFRPGTELLYDLNMSTTAQTLTAAQRSAGREGIREFEGTESLRWLYAVENTYKVKSGYEGLLRMQGESKKGKDYVFISAGGQPPRTYNREEFAPIYSRITGTGREVFSSLPYYIAFEGTAGEGSLLDLIGYFPWPVLPTRPVKPGDSWQAALDGGRLDFEKMRSEDKFARFSAAKGTFEGIEWQYGMPCAKIRTVITVNTAVLSTLTRGEVPDLTQSGEERVWVALDRGIPVKWEKLTIQEQKITRNVAPQGAGTGTGSRGTGGGGMSTGAQGASGSGGGGTSGVINQAQPGGRRAGGGGGQATGGSGAGAGTRGQRGGGTTSVTEYRRITTKLSFDLVFPGK